MKRIISINWALFLLLPVVSKVYAICPVCTIAAGAGLGISRYLGIDDAIIGIWLGGLILSGGMWASSVLKDRHIKLPYLAVWMVLLFYLFTIIPLYFTNMIGIPGNTQFGIDKVIFGIGVGSICFLFGALADIVLRAMNDCKVNFYYQKVILPISFLLIATGVVYFFNR